MKISVRALARTGAAFFASALAMATTVSARASALKTLAGHVPEVVSQLTPKADMPSTNRLSLAIGLPLRDPQGLEAYLTQLYDPASPNYHQYLTPAQFTAQFGPTEADYAAVKAFAQANGLTVTTTHPNRLVLDVNGEVGDIQRALQVHLRTYRHPTENRDFFAPDANPTIDAALPITDVSGLNNYVLPRPKNVRRANTTAENAEPHSGSGPGGGYMGNDFRAAYLPGGTLTGSGQIVGLLEFDGYYASDITAYTTAAGDTAVPVQSVLLDGYDGTPTTGANSGNDEVSLDIEMAIALAPGLSKVVSFEAGPNGLQNDIINAMAASNQIKQFSCSWGWGGGPSATTDNIFKEMAAQGQSFFTAAGDSDAFTTGASSANGVDNPNLANAPASSPYITAVGGTTLTTASAGGAWSSEKVWNWGNDNGSYVGTCGGISSYYAIPSWQSGISIAGNGGSTSFRNIPDVAMAGDNIYVKYGDGSGGTLGGTSCAAPLWAAFAALMNQQAAAAGHATIGFVNPALYAIAKTSSYDFCFHDITTGNNTSSTSPSEFYAESGYDLCTGLGTPNGENLIDAMVGAPDSLSVTPNAAFAASGMVGGPFTPATQTFVLSNASSSSVTWLLPEPPYWLAAAPTNGVLPGHGVASVTVGFNAAASDLAAGVYATNITFSNVTTRVAQSESVSLSVGQSILVNGGFETGDFTGWTLVGQTTSGNSRQPIVYNAVESASSGFSVVHSGAYGAFLGDSSPATLSQSVATAPGQNYLLSFWLTDPTGGSGEAFSANWNGATLARLSNPASFGWTNFQYVVTAAGDSATVQFTAENQPDYFGLDDVSLTPIPTVGFRQLVKTGNAFTLSWTATTGVAYQAQYTTNLTNPVWVNLAAPQTASGNSLSITDSNATASSPQRFYRLVVAP